MVKNWMILGDDAFDSESKPVGVIRLTPDEMDNWQNVAWGRFADVVNNNPLVRKMVFGCNYLYVGGSFNKKTPFHRTFSTVDCSVDTWPQHRIHLDSAYVSVPPDLQV